MTQEQRDATFDKTNVNASIRGRKQWGNKRGLTLSGEAAGIDEARQMAHRFIMRSAEADDGEARPPSDDDDDDTAAHPRASAAAKRLKSSSATQKRVQAEQAQEAQELKKTKVSQAAQKSDLKAVAEQRLQMTKEWVAWQQAEA